MKIACFVAAALIGVSCLAQAETPEIPPAPGEGVEHVEHAPAYPHPTLPGSGQLWTVPMVIIVAGLFLAAAFVGPLHRMEMPPEEPTAHGHDDHAAGHGHH